MTAISVTVLRYNPKTDTAPHPVSYTVDILPGSTVLTALETIHDTIDATLMFRRCCRSGQCGSCALRVNGEPVLACEKTVSDGDKIEPLNLPVLCDLITDIAPVIARLGRLESESGCCHRVTADDIASIKPLRTCIECFSCVSACPAVGRFAGPAIFAKEARLFFDPRNIRDRIPVSVENGLFSCTTCRKCVEVCPKHIDVPGKAIEKLRAAAVSAGYGLKPHESLASLIERTGRSVAETRTTFLAETAGVYEPEGTVKGTVGFFVGCMGNARVKQSVADAIYVLTHNGYRVSVPKSQVCCGSPLIRTGHTGIVPELQRKNIAAFQGIDTVITVCAGCGSTLKNDYPDIPFTVYDFTEFLVKTGFKPVLKKVPGTFTYHDPCHLLRGQGIHDQPREIIRSCVDTFIDIPPHCCGAGGGVRSGNPDEAAEIGSIRAEMIQNSGAKSVLTVCPFCEYHLYQTTGFPVINIATLLAYGYRNR